MIEGKFSGYQILTKLGGGNTGVVYKALDEERGRTVAIKVLPNDLLVSREKQARFKREAMAARALSHPALARVYAQGENYLVMEYVDGRSYREVVEEFPEGVPLDRFFKLMLPLLDGIAYAHEQNLVHRDLKPENLKLDAAERPKVLDFGLVKFLDHEPSSEDSFQTMAGMVLGSAGYMSPEQAEGLAFDARTDVFSLGVIMYELLTGKNPFHAPSPFATIARIIKATPLSLELVRPEIPLPLCHAVLKCLAKEMDQRFADARAIQHAIDGLKF